MRFVAKCSTADTVPEAVEHVTRELTAELGGAPDLVVVFTARHAGEVLTEIAHRVHADSPGALVLGATAEATLSGPRELEGRGTR